MSHTNLRLRGEGLRSPFIRIFQQEQEQEQPFIRRRRGQSRKQSAAINVDYQDDIRCDVMSGFDNRQPIEQDHPITISDPKVLSKFVRQVYLFSTLFCLISVVPWIIISWSGIILGEHIPVPAFVWLILALICLIILSCCPHKRFKYPCNRILSVITVFLITLFGSYYMFMVNTWVLLGSLLASGSFVVLLSVCGAKCPLRMLPNECSASIVIGTCVILLFTLGILMFFLRSPIFYLAIGIVLIVLVITMGLYQARYVHGRQKFIPLEDAPLCAMGIYTYFVINLVCFSGFYYFYLEAIQNET
ncbi:uncharacterized protein LOC108040746 [Drosophila rhopaloa]|uniref:Uncharacterized protein LOC108040746 n=1 Tax=Drosophila rhopaloa TaxID=1041015 RepID=A0A6P4EFL8_DRORH|nr:uncharacterized protein LOC108040746 [Drosophila rhopaloa]